MATLVHADIFFFVTTFAVVFVGASLTVVLIYLAKVLQDIKTISHEIKEETILFREDIKDFRETTRREGTKIANLASLAAKMFSRGAARGGHRRARKG